MSSLTILTYEGVLQPQNSRTCGQEFHAQSSPLQIFRQRSNFDLQESVLIKENFEAFFKQDNPFFWKERMIFHMLVSPSILSMSFVPHAREKCHMLFLQKMHLSSEITGFVIPGEKNSIPMGHLIWDQDSIERSLGQLDRCFSDVKPILNYFLKDTTSTFVAITCLQDSATTTHGWFKV